MFVAECFLSNIVHEYGKHPFLTDGGTRYPQACRFLKIKHHAHSPYKKSLIEKTMHYFKDRTECFDDHFPCKRKKCRLNHISNWLNLFIDQHKKRYFLELTVPFIILYLFLNYRISEFLNHIMFFLKSPFYFLNNIF